MGDNREVSGEFATEIYSFIASKVYSWMRRDDGTPDGTVFMPFAYREAAANLLTNAALDPVGKIPEFKYCAVSITPAGPVETSKAMA